MVINARSLRNKLEGIKAILSSHEPEALVITESRMKCDITQTI